MTQLAEGRPGPSDDDVGDDDNDDDDDGDDNDDDDDDQQWRLEDDQTSNVEGRDGEDLASS